MTPSSSSSGIGVAIHGFDRPCGIFSWRCGPRSPGGGANTLPRPMPGPMTGPMPASMPMLLPGGPYHGPCCSPIGRPRPIPRALTSPLSSAASCKKLLLPSCRAPSARISPETLTGVSARTTLIGSESCSCGSSCAWATSSNGGCFLIASRGVLTRDRCAFPARLPFEPSPNTDAFAPAVVDVEAMPHSTTTGVATGGASSAEVAVQPALLAAAINSCAPSTSIVAGAPAPLPLSSVDGMLPAAAALPRRRRSRCLARFAALAAPGICVDSSAEPCSSLLDATFRPCSARTDSTSCSTSCANCRSKSLQETAGGCSNWCHCCRFSGLRAGLLPPAFCSTLRIIAMSSQKLLGHFMTTVPSNFMDASSGSCVPSNC
mmetsp:Transcript_7057/g.13102  ORF Transcript_7057/g.13102 Transcript_7057/m.13102 type:complete len:375 (+) Transcript_7057:466-1590(+)